MVGGERDEYQWRADGGMERVWALGSRLRLTEPVSRRLRLVVRLPAHFCFKLIFLALAVR